ncbi:MAG: hypothetical protein AAGB93_24620, partial [Planctomycetota bacterium]
MLRTIAPAAAALLVGLAASQERVDVLYRLSFQSGPPLLGVIELDAGGATPADLIDLQALTPFPMDGALCLERVGSEVWLGTRDGVLRYGGSPLSYVGQALPGERIRSMVPTAFGAVASVRVAAGPGLPPTFAVELDAGGSETRRIETTPRFFDDLAVYQGGFLGLAGDAVLRMDADYEILGEFAAEAAGMANQLDLAYSPSEITVLDDGRVVISAFFTTAVVDPDGTVAEVFLTPFVVGAFPTGAGPLLSIATNGLYLIDADELEFLGTASPGWSTPPLHLSTRYGSAAPGATERLCTTVQNSTGAAARLHLLASDSASQRTLKTVATDLPPGTFGLPIYGPAPTDVALGDGRLCVSPFTPGLTRGPVARATAEGTLQTGFDFVTPGLGAGFVAGTT